jgi:hypothetical protein
MEEPTSEEIKEVYARFGLAYYEAECIHRGLCNLYSFLQMPSRGPITRQRVEEHLRDSFDLTLGQLIRTVLPRLAYDLQRDLQHALKDRNFLAHHFWYERSHLFGTTGGINRMLEELSAYILEFEEVDERLNILLVPYLERVGATPELLGGIMERLRLGEPDEALIQQRKPLKTETIIAAYHVPVESGKSLLVFQSDDGLLWQLCDAGLGWTSYKEVGNDWVPALKFAPHLPARINPRPKTVCAWEYTLIFNNASLAVRPGKTQREILYKFEISETPRHK